ncbi:MAG: DUF3048 domain-containing protein [Actinomycetota bacterium]|nr:DUF3048 domain-containing protein [Actinomycetota bacterium]
MSNLRRGLLVAGGVVVVGLVALVLVAKNTGVRIPVIDDVVDADPVCPLTGLDPDKESALERPAVAVKIENAEIAYPLSGLDKAEVVYEEPVEGGLTRFMAIYHCTDVAKAGPVRSSRVVDPAIMSPYTRILAAAGGNDIVRKALEKEGIVLVDEDGSGEAMERVPREGLPTEHTLYADVAELRELGEKDYKEPPADDVFKFGDLEGKARDARSISIDFSPSVNVSYEWNGKGWARSDNGQPQEVEGGGQITVDNVIIEEHTISNSTTLFDVEGNPSPEITDVTGSGRAVLFRDKKAIEGRWVRKSDKDRVTFETEEGEEMVLKKGTTWIELVPDKKGDLKGSFSFK